MFDGVSIRLRASEHGEAVKPSSSRFGRVRWACGRGSGGILGDESNFQRGRAFARHGAAGLASFNESKDACEVEQPDAFDLAGFTNGNGADETFARPFVKFRPRAAGEKLMPAFGRSNPHWQMTVALGCQLRGAGLCVLSPAQTILHIAVYHGDN